MYIHKNSAKNLDKKSVSRYVLREENSFTGDEDSKLCNTLYRPNCRREHVRPTIVVRLHCMKVRAQKRHGIRHCSEDAGGHKDGA